MLRIGGSGCRGVMIVFLSPVRGRLFVLIVVGLVGRVYYKVGEIFLSTPSVLGWPLGIGWVLKIG